MTDNIELDLAVAAPGGATVVTYAAQPVDPTLPVFRLMWPNLVLRFALFLTEPRDALLRAATEVTSALEQNLLSPLPVHSFELDDVAAAHEAVENGITGKVVLDLRGPAGAISRPCR
nr:zinc-binding dehydrogenase [Amycolatopsis jiangsuensis]